MPCEHHQSGGVHWSQWSQDSGQLAALRILTTPSPVVSRYTPLCREPVLSQALPGLRELAKETLGALFDARGLQAALKGQVTRLVGDVYRIRYEFDDPSDLEDFTLGEDFQRERFESWRKLDLQDSQHVAAVMAGSFMLRGYHCYRHVLSFVTPTVRYELVYPKPDGDALSMVMVGICEDGLGHYMAATDSHDLEVYASGGHQEHVELVGEERIFYPDVTYNLVLGFDDEQEASLRVNGKRLLRVTTGDLSEGDVFILSYAQKTMKIESFEIEGKLAKGALAGLRKVWLERQLEESGF